MRRSAFLGALLALASSLPSVAFADLAAQARFHHEQARAHYVARHYEEALEEFFAVQRIAPSPGNLFNIARCFERLERPEDSFLFYSQYLASDDDDQGLRAQATEQLEALRAEVARVRVVTTPPGADVFVDQRDRGRYGRAPMLVAVAPGERTITVALDGYRSATTTVVAARGTETQVSLELTQILGAMTVSGAGSGTYSLSDASGEVVAEGALGERLAVPPAQYVVSVEMTGHQPWRSIAEVLADEDRALFAEPLRLPERTGAVTVTANRAGALVRLDGEPAGFVPLSLTSVSLGEHQIEVSQAGVRSWSGALEVNADERAWVTAQLTPPAATERSVFTWVFGGVGAAGLLAGITVAALAADQRASHDALLMASPTASALQDSRNEGAALNLAADTLLLSGAVMLGVAALLFFLTESTRDEPSSAAIAREAL